MEEILACEDISCSRADWKGGCPSRVEHLSVSISPHSLTGVVGEDGCGKGLFLNMLGLLEPPDNGRIRYGRDLVSEMPIDDLRRLRNESFGFVFEHPCLLPAFSVAENVAMPLFRFCHEDAAGARDRMMETLDFCGISDVGCELAGNLPYELQPLAALARALVHRPRILVAISPRYESLLLPIVTKAIQQSGLTVLWAGQVPTLERHAHRILQLREGRLVKDLIL